MARRQSPAERLVRRHGVVTADGYEEALLGVLVQPGRRPAVAVYARERCLAILQARDGMSEEEAVEWFEFNVAGSYVGPQTPLFVETPWPGQFPEGPGTPAPSGGAERSPVE